MVSKGYAISKVYIRKDSKIQNDTIHVTYPRIEKEGLRERAIILCKLNKNLLESSTSVDIHYGNTGCGVFKQALIKFT